MLFKLTHINAKKPKLVYFLFALYFLIILLFEKII